MSIKIGIVIYGACKNKNGFWETWMEKSRELIGMIGYTPTHVGITGTSLSSKLRTLQRSGKKIREVIESGEPIRSFAMYSLPEDFHTVTDNNCWLGINAEYAYCEMNFEECSEELMKRIKDMLLDFVEMEQCEIFKMDKNQVPYNYVFKGRGNDISAYPTLEILYRRVLQ